MTITHVGTLPVTTFAADTVVSIAADADLRTVAVTLTEAGVGVLAVGQRDEVLGVVSERDLVQALAADRDPSTTTAIDIAHKTLVWCDAASTVAEVAEEMMEHYVRHVLVEDGGRLIGVVSARDLLGAYVAAESIDP